MFIDMDLSYEDTVFITKGKHKGRIGCYDDDETENSLIIYFGNSMLVCPAYSIIKRSYLRKATIDDLIKRKWEISDQITPLDPKTQTMCPSKKYELLLELNYIDIMIYEMFIKSKFADTKNLHGITVFISHSSKDKWFARKLETDLKCLGLNPWLDETQIAVGESIIKKVQHAVQYSDFCIVVLSKNSINSAWVKQEWESVLWKEISNEQEVRIIPVLLEECEIPHFLATKKYANFTRSYNDGLSELLQGMEKLYQYKKSLLVSDIALTEEIK